MIISKNLKLYGGPLVSFETTTLNFNLFETEFEIEIEFLLEMEFQFEL